MNGLTNLGQILGGLTPILDTRLFVYCTVPGTDGLGVVLERAEAMVRETEAITLILIKDHADVNKLKYTAEFERITLRVHSSLEAVGLTAAVSTALADAGISANMVAGFFHDHIYVPAGCGAKAMDVLNLLAKQ